MTEHHVYELCLTPGEAVHDHYKGVSADPVLRLHWHQTVPNMRQPPDKRLARVAWGPWPDARILATWPDPGPPSADSGPYGTPLERAHQLAAGADRAGYFDVCQCECGVLATPELPRRNRGLLDLIECCSPRWYRTCEHPNGTPCEHPFLQEPEAEFQARVSRKRATRLRWQARQRANAPKLAASAAAAATALAEAKAARLAEVEAQNAANRESYEARQRNGRKRDLVQHIAYRAILIVVLVAVVAFAIVVLTASGT